MEFSIDSEFHFDSYRFLIQTRSQEAPPMSLSSFLARVISALALASLLFLPSRSVLGNERTPQVCPVWDSGEAASPEESAAAEGSVVGTSTCAAGGWACQPRPNAQGFDYTAYTCTNSLGCFEETSGSNYTLVFGFGNDLHCANDQLTKDVGPCCNGKGDPINGGTGNKYQIEVDYPRIGGLEFVRTYNSLIYGDATVLGFKWRHSWDRSIYSLSGLVAVVFRPDGKRFRYNPPSSGTVWTPDPDVVDQLEKLGDGTWRLTTASNEVELFDTAGKLQSVTSASGDVTTMSYSDGTSSGPNGAVYEDAPTVPVLAGKLIRVTDFHGRSLQLKYNRRGTLRRMVDPAGNVHEYTVDMSFGTLVSVKYPTLKTRTYLYNEPAYYGFSNVALTGIVDEKGARYSTTRYSNNFAISTELAGGVDKHTITADSPQTYVDPLGTTRTITYSTTYGVTRVSGITQPCPGCGTSTQTNVLDANGNTVSTKDFNGNLTCYAFDTVRNLETARTEGLNGAGTCAARQTTSATRTITTEWHSALRLVKRTAEPLRITTWSYNGEPGISCAPTGASSALLCSKSVQATTDADGSQAFSATSDGAARAWAYTYNLVGQVLTVDGPRTDVADLTTFSYYAADDPSGNYKTGDLASITNALNQATQFTQYDPNGRLKKSIDSNGLETILAYSSRGWLASRQVGTSGSGYETTTYDYDDNGSLIKVTLPDASYVSYTYDDARRLTDLQDGLGNHIHYTLDNAGNRTAENAYDTSATLVRTHTRVIDALNRVSQEIGGTSPSTQITQFGFDPNGNVTSITDPLSRVTTQLYDARNRLTEVRDPFNGASAPTKYEYNGQHQLTKVIDPASLATLYTLNGHGELLTQVSPDTGNATFTYDAASNVKTKVDARGVQASYIYDALNRVAQIVYPDETVNYTYDACPNGLGRLCSIVDGAGSTTFGYDLQGRVVSKTQVIGSQTQTVGYAYNSAGQLIMITLPSARKVTYSYANNRPVSVALDGQTVLDGVFYEPFGPNGGWRWGNSTIGAVNTHTRIYDKDFRATRITSDLPASGTQPYFDRQLSWDAQSRVQSITDLSNAALNATYGYDALDRLTSTSQSGANATYTYTGLGDRMTSAFNTAGSTYTYAPATHRLQQVSGAQSRNFTFDAAGNVTGDGTKTWTFGGNNRNKQVVSGSGTTSYGVNALGQRVSKIDGTGKKTYFAYDEKGHLLGEYDGTGQPIAETIWLEDLPVAVAR
jgi:YD repeat-containing protein